MNIDFKKLRTDLGLTKVDVVEKSKISMHGLTQIENKNFAVSAHHMISLIEFYGLDIGKDRGLSRLERFKRWYDINLQLFNGEYNIFLERGGVTLFHIGGYESIEKIIDETEAWIIRVRRSEH